LGHSVYKLVEDGIYRKGNVSSHLIKPLATEVTEVSEKEERP
jgi:hypothetical protein